ncbi:MAG: TIGR00296 family protein, partial [Methanosarcinaceae archaeon]
MLTISEGEQAVSLARDTIESLLKDGQKIGSSSRVLARVFNEKRGVFVTLTICGDLRGCIGHPYPDSTLKDAIVDSAISAATRDPRFPAVQMSEMDTITV